MKSSGLLGLLLIVSVGANLWLWKENTVLVERDLIARAEAASPAFRARRIVADGDLSAVREAVAADFRADLTRILAPVFESLKLPEDQRAAALKILSGFQADAATLRDELPGDAAERWAGMDGQLKGILGNDYAPVRSFLSTVRYRLTLLRFEQSTGITLAPEAREKLVTILEDETKKALANGMKLDRALDRERFLKERMEVDKRALERAKEVLDPKSVLAWDRFLATDRDRQAALR